MLVEVSAADGLLDAALLARYEVALRPEPLRWPEWLAGQMGKIERALDFFETHPRDGENPSLADIAVACALGYLDFRFAHLDWRASRPRLAAFAGMAVVAIEMKPNPRIHGDAIEVLLMRERRRQRAHAARRWQRPQWRLQRLHHDGAMANLAQRARRLFEGRAMALPVVARRMTLVGGHFTTVTRRAR